jgi:hypothetical protein
VHIINEGELVGLAHAVKADWFVYYCVAQDVSSITNDVCSEESSVPRK